MIYVASVLCFFLGYSASLFCARRRMADLDQLCAELELDLQEMTASYMALEDDKKRQEDLRALYRMSLPTPCRPPDLQRIK